MASPNNLRSLQLDMKHQIDNANKTIAELEIKKESEKQLALADHRTGKKTAGYHLGRMKAHEKEIADTMSRIKYYENQITGIDTVISTVIKRNTLKKTKTLAKGGRLTRRRRARTRRSH